MLVSLARPGERVGWGGGIPGTGCHVVGRDSARLRRSRGGSVSFADRGGDVSPTSYPRALAAPPSEHVHGGQECAPAAVLPFYEGEARSALLIEGAT